MDENSKEVPLTAVKCLFHPISFPWKLIFALIPPPALWHGWLAFLSALAIITGISSVLIKLARLFGCITGILEALVL